MNRECIERKNVENPNHRVICVDWDERVFALGYDRSNARRLIEQNPTRFYPTERDTLLRVVIQLLDASPDLASTLDGLDVSVATRLEIQSAYREWKNDRERCS